MNNQQEINNYFDLEKKKHFDFFLPYYKEKNWQIVQDNINSGQKNDWDVKLEFFAGQYALIDEKVRQGEFNDCLIEIIQDMETGTLGWYFSKKDWILYGSWANMEDIYPSSLYLIKSKELKEYINRLNGFPNNCISKKGWGITWNLIISWDELIKTNIAEKLL